MYKKILVPLDGSKRAEAILRHVEELAQRYQAKVIFLQVIRPGHIYTGVHGYVTEQNLEDSRREALMEGAENYLANLKGEFREKGISAKFLVEEGPIVNAIISAAEREKADLIAMASHGYTGLSHVFYGSVAAGVLHRIDRPLLLIRANGTP